MIDNTNVHFKEYEVIASPTFLMMQTQKDNYG